MEDKPRHNESVSGHRMTDFDVQSLHRRTTYYSGQGKVYLAPRDARGHLSEYRFLGNIPQFTVYPDGRIEILCEAWSRDSWPLLFGGECADARVGDVDGPGYFFGEPFTSGKMRCYTMEPTGNKGEYGLLFEGINTADSRNGVRLELYRVTFEAAADGIAFISDSIAAFPLHARYHRDEVRARDASLGAYGRVFVWE